MEKKGLTLVEILIVMAIILLLIAVAVGGLDPIGIMNRARDAQRKKDLNRIKISFEDYFNDKGCYPSKAKVEELNLVSSCDSNVVFRPWMARWPCDPNDKPYLIEVGYDDDCPKWYKILTSLENKTDKDILEEWKLNGNLWIGTTDINYGVSSGNVTIEEIMAEKDPYCKNLGGCYYYPAPNMCNKTTAGCSGWNCYLGECSIRCHVDCCGVGCD
jgi:prepilin-type N-terminal cleavage/methylation domain-containing protein